MRLERLTVSNLRGLRSVTMDLSPQVTLILGNQGSGKSSLAGAVQYALAGHNRWTDGAGKGAARLIRHGTKTGAVDLDTDAGNIWRTIDTKGSSLGVGDRGGKAAQAALEAILPAPELLDAMLTSDGLIGLPPKQQQELLFTLAGGEVGAAWFRERLEAAEVECIEAELATRLKGAALADRLYQTAYGMRTEANRRVKELQARAKEQPAVATADGRAAANIAAELANSRQVLETTLTRLGQAQQTQADHERAKQRSIAADALVSKLRDEIASLGDRPEAPASADMVLAAERLPAVEDSILSLAEDIAGLDAQAGALTDQLQDFGRLEGCVLGGVDCPLTTEQRQAAMAKAREQVAAWEATAEGLRSKRSATNAERQTLTTKLAEMRQAADAADRWEQRQGDLSARLAQAEVDAKEALAAYQASGSVNIEELQAQAGRERERIVALEMQQTEANLAAKAAEQRQELAADLEAAEQHAATLDGLVRKLGPDGLPAQAMAETVGAVLDQVNTVLTEISEFTLRAEPGKEFALLVDRPGGVTRVDCLSEGESLLVGVAVQVALAKLTGFGAVVVDRCNVLDGYHRGALLGMLLESGVQAVVLAIPSNGHRPVAEGLTVYELDSGMAVLVEQEEAVEV